MKVSGYSFSDSLIPTITGGAYSAGDALGNEMVIDFGLGGKVDNHSAFIIQSISVVDQAKQSAATDLFFFNASVTASADNAAADFTDAQLKSNFLGHVVIAAADYGALNDNSVATVRNIGLQLKPEVGGTDFKIYCYAVTRGTPTYVTTTDLQFNFHFAADL